VNTALKLTIPFKWRISLYQHVFLFRDYIPFTAKKSGTSTASDSRVPGKQHVGMTKILDILFTLSLLYHLLFFHELSSLFLFLLFLFFSRSVCESKQTA
jgi:hypothetical protein